VRRRSLRLAALLGGVLACSLVASTSWALYLTSMGPEQCCKSHCGHPMPRQAAERCCRTHLTAAPAVVAKVAAPDHVALPPPAVVMPAPVAATSVAVVTIGSDLRAPPGGSLLTQRTSLTL
jgi:hypothetical protein